MIKIELGEYIKKVRTGKKLSLRKAAEMAGVSHPYLSQLETGSHNNPSASTLEKLAKGLDIDYNYLSYLAGYVNVPNIENDKNLTTAEKEEKIKKVISTIPDHIYNDPFQKVPKTVFIPKSINILDEKSNTETEISTTHEHLFDLYYLLQLEVDLCYNKKPLTNENKKDILKFIENFIIK